MLPMAEGRAAAAGQWWGVQGGSEGERQEEAE